MLGFFPIGQEKGGGYFRGPISASVNAWNRAHDPQKIGALMANGGGSYAPVPFLLGFGSPKSWPRGFAEGCLAEALLSSLWSRLDGLEIAVHHICAI